MTRRGAFPNCERCHKPITFYAHQHYEDGRLHAFHPECCPIHWEHRK